MQQAKAAQRRAAADRESATRPEQSQPPAALPPGFLNLSREEYAAADISRMPHHSAAAAAASGGQPAAGPGEGPGGARLFDAEWVREPTKAELAPYFDGGWTTAGWATIACRTVDRFRVEDCRELDESPPGSGLARGLRQAAWQFLVRPPRIEGKALLGTWVRIRFEFSRSGSDEGR
jgi:protein TonB